MMFRGEQQAKVWPLFTFSLFGKRLKSKHDKELKLWQRLKALLAMTHSKGVVAVIIFWVGMVMTSSTAIKEVTDWKAVAAMTA
jgi:hypothetical protein